MAGALWARNTQIKLISQASPGTVTMPLQSLPDTPLLTLHPVLTNVVVVDNRFTCFRDANDQWGGPASLSQELPAELAGADSLYRLELEVEVRQVVETRRIAGLGYIHRGVDQQGTGMADSHPVHKGEKGLPGCPLEEPAEGFSAHAGSARDIGPSGRSIRFR